MQRIFFLFAIDALWVTRCTIHGATAAYTAAKISSSLSFLLVSFCSVTGFETKADLFAIPTEILPLVEFYIEEDISAEEALQLIKTEPPKGSNELKNGGEDYQVYENDSQPLADPFASYFYSQQVVLNIWKFNRNFKIDIDF